MRYNPLKCLNFSLEKLVFCASKGNFSFVLWKCNCSNTDKSSSELRTFANRFFTRDWLIRITHWGHNLGDLYPHSQHYNYPVDTDFFVTFQSTLWPLFALFNSIYNSHFFNAAEQKLRNVNSWPCINNSFKQTSSLTKWSWTNL